MSLIFGSSDNFQLVAGTVAMPNLSAAFIPEDGVKVVGMGRAPVGVACGAWVGYAAWYEEGGDAVGIVRLAVCDGCQKAVMVSAREGLHPDGWQWIYPCDSGLAKLYCVPCSAARRPRGMDSQTLDHELGVYRSRLDELLGPGDVNEGKFVVIKGDDVSEVGADLDSALLLGYERFGDVPFLIRKIERVETIHRI